MACFVNRIFVPKRRPDGGGDLTNGHGVVMLILPIGARMV